MTIATGAWAAALTPLNQDLGIDAGAYVAHAQSLMAKGAAGIVALGTTGEANSFSLDERRALIAAIRDLPKQQVIVGTGCCSAPETVALTRTALEHGFANVLMLPPFYYKGVSDEGLFRAYARVIETVNDPKLRVLIYDIPPQTGFALSVDLLRRLRDAFPATVVGVKNSSGDWSAMEATLKALPGFQTFAGSEQYLLATLRAGGPGCISAVANINVGKLAEIVASRSDDQQDRATQTRKALQPFPTIAALKEIMAHATGRDAWRTLRPPLIELTREQRTALAALTERLDLTP